VRRPGPCLAYVAVFVLNRAAETAFQSFEDTRIVTRASVSKESKQMTWSCPVAEYRSPINCRKSSKQLKKKVRRRRELAQWLPRLRHTSNKPDLSHLTRRDPSDSGLCVVAILLGSSHPRAGGPNHRQLSRNLAPSRARVHVRVGPGLGDMKLRASTPLE
jgi:hypothetical protein